MRFEYCFVQLIFQTWKICYIFTESGPIPGQNLVLEGHSKIKTFQYCSTAYF